MNILKTLEVDKDCQMKNIIKSLSNIIQTIQDLQIRKFVCYL